MSNRETPPSDEQFTTSSSGCLGVLIQSMELQQIHTSRAVQAGGGSFKRQKKIRQRKNLPTECAQGDQPVQCPNRVFCVHQPSAVLSGGGVLVMAGCVSVVCRWWCFGDVMCRDVVCDVMQDVM